MADTKKIAEISKKIGKIALIVLLSLITFVVFLWGGINIAKFGIYAEYFSVKEDVCTNPGLNDGFVCQSVAYVDEEGKILVGGHMSKDGPVRIYVTDKNSNSYYVSVTKDDEILSAHAGGLGCYNDTIYIAADNSLYCVSLADVLSATNGGTVAVTSVIPVNNESSFIYIDDERGYLYVGEFHRDGTQYLITPDHHYNGNHSIIERYSLSNLSKPDLVYSIPDEVQGVCFAEGKIVFSTSWGLADSHYLIYNESDAYDSGKTFGDTGAPVYFLGDCVRDLKGPAMSEGLDYMDGKIVTLSESASNLYVFGKFFFAFQIVALDIL